MDLEITRKATDKDATGVELDDAALDGVAGGEYAPLDDPNWDPNNCPECGGEMKWMGTALKVCKNCGYVR